MNIVEFAIKFKDMASKEMNAFSTHVRTTYTQAQHYADNVTGRNKVLGQSYVALQARMREVESTIANSTIPSQIKAAKRELAALQKSAGSHMGNIKSSTAESSGGGMSAGSLLKRFAGPAAIAAAGYKAAQFFGSAIQESLERQKIQTSFNVLAGSDKAGGALTAELVKLQKDTILGKEVFKNAQTMMGYGFDSTEITKNLKMLGDVSMGDSNKLNSLTLAFSQSKAAGRLTGQDLLQMVNAGFNPLQQMVESTGKTYAQLRKEMENGNISFDMVQQAFQDATGEGGKFNNMLEQIAATPAGKVEQLKGAWDEVKIKAGEAFMPLLSFAMDLANKLMPYIEAVLTPLTDGVKQVMSWVQGLKSETGGWMDYLVTIKDLFTEHLIPYMMKLWNAVSHIVSRLFEFVKSSELLKDIFKAVSVIVGGIYDFLGALIDSLVWIFDKIVMPILNGIEKAYRWIKGSKGEVATTSTAKLVIKQPDKSAVEETNSDLIKDIADNTKENNELANNNKEEVTSGGPKNIYITIQKFLDSINIHTNTARESTEEIEQVFLEMFGRVVVQSANNIR